MDPQCVEIRGRRRVQIALERAAQVLRRIAGDAVHSLDPVSYTHLDVYKRQDFCLLQTQIFSATGNSFADFKIIQFHKHLPP